MSQSPSITPSGSKYVPPQRRPNPPYPSHRRSDSSASSDSSSSDSSFYDSSDSSCSSPSSSTRWSRLTSPSSASNPASPRSWSNKPSPPRSPATSWGGQPSTTRQAQRASRSSSPPANGSRAGQWRDSAAPPPPRASKASELSTIEVGLVCKLPHIYTDVAAGAEIRKHPDFTNADGSDKADAWNHPCMVAATGYKDGLVMCTQLTAFSDNPGGLLVKYRDQGHSLAPYRKRWLLIEQQGGVPNHDSLPLLGFRDGASMKRSTYVNTDNFFFIDPQFLGLTWVDDSLVHVKKESVGTALAHHDEHFGSSPWGPNRHPKEA